MDSILADSNMMEDLLKYGTMLIVARLLAGKDLSGEGGDQWPTRTLLFTLAGLASYHLVTKKFVPGDLLGDNAQVQTVIDTCLKWGSMLVVQRLLSKQALDKQWMLCTAYTLAGFSAWELVGQGLGVSGYVSDMVGGNDNIKNALDDALMMGTMSVVSRLLEGASLEDRDWQMGTLYTMVGISTYHFGPNMLL